MFFVGAVTLASAALGLGVSPSSADLPAADRAPLIKAERRAVDGQYIVMLERGMSSAKVRAAATRARDEGAAVRHVYSSVDGYAAALTRSQLDTVRSDPSVAYVEQVRVMRADDTQTDATWGLDRVDQRDLPLSDSYTSSATGLGVTTYVIDTGVNATHHELAGRVGTGYTAIADGGGTGDCNGHGTHVSGTIAGTTYGVAKEATVITLRVIDCAGSGWSSGVIAGLDWIAGLSAAGPRVANMSLGGDASTAVDDAVSRLVNSGVAVAASAGNLDQDACAQSPARVPAAITVGSSTRTDARSPFSNWGSCVDLFAPGSDITSAWSGSNTATNTISGTSMASPHVAGAAALYLQDNPSASPAAVMSGLIGDSTLGKILDPRGSPNRLLFTDPPGVSAPNAPTGIVAVHGESRATVSWTAAAANGSPITTYTMTSSPGGHTITVPGDQTTGTITGLTNGTAYTFTVTATNAVGTSPASAPSNTVTPRAAPSAPTEVSATRGDQQAAVAWTAPNANGSPITGYTITSAPGGLTETVTGADATSVTIGGLTNGTGYTFTVRATNAIGTSPASAASNAVTPAGVPETVATPSAVRGDKSAVVSWSKPSGNGTPVTGYTVASVPGGVTKTVPGDQTTATISGLPNGSGYTFTVTATNAVGDSRTSEPSNEVTPAGVPEQMRGAKVAVRGSKAIVKWAAADPNGSPVTRYEVDISKGKDKTLAATAYRTVFKKLEPGRYKVRVTARNALGSGPSGTWTKFRIR